MSHDDDNPSLICSKCGTIGNNDDLAFLGEPCPRSEYEDDDCDGVMLLSTRDNDSVAGSHISWRRVGGEPILHVTTNPGGYDMRGATMLAHAILSEVEIAQRPLPPPRPDGALTFDEVEAAGLDGTLRST